MILKGGHNNNNNNVISSIGGLGTMHRAAGTRIKITELNDHLTCKLCKGYFIDATTIIECLHTFCKSCIVQYLEKNKYCPECDVQVHKTKPLLNIRPDKTLQDIVYKLVPRLFQNELQRWQDYYTSHPEAKPASLEQKKEIVNQHIFSPDETICLTLSYQGSSARARYLSCQMAVSVAHIEKLIRAKYDLSNCHKIDVFYKDDCLASHLTLMDVAYIYLWKRKEPLEFTYKIYERTVKRLKLAPGQQKQSNSDWKEVHLQISENGEMSVTGIQDAIDLLRAAEHNEDVKKNATDSISDVKQESTNTDTLSSTSEDVVDVVVKGKDDSAVSIVKNEEVKNTVPEEKKSTESKSAAISEELEVKTKCSPVDNTNSSTTSAAAAISKDDCHNNKTSPHPIITSTSSCGTKMTFKYNKITNSERKKHKLDAAEKKTDEEPSEKQTKPSVEKLSSNHPLKKHSQLAKNSSPAVTIANTTSTVSVSETTDLKKCSTVNVSPPTTTTTTSPSTKTNAVLINSSNSNTRTSDSYSNSIPKVNKKNPAQSANYAAKSQPINVPMATSQTQQQPSTSVKAKRGTPIGYKTLRDPPKTWNPQVARPNLSKTAPTTTTTDSNNVRPAKFFKMRNNMPRYLGNPASGVKPMYHVQDGGGGGAGTPEKEVGKKVAPEKCEIKKHSIVKIDPKTLKPISERAPDTANLSNHSSGELKINTSSVSIFSPLKMQSSSSAKGSDPHHHHHHHHHPHHQQQQHHNKKSPKSPQQKSQKSTSSPPPPPPAPPPSNKQQRDKINLNFTPPNPFVPNLTSPTLSPSQFLYPSPAATPPSPFPPYDPRVMAVYRNFLYGQSLSSAGYPPAAQLGALSVDLNHHHHHHHHRKATYELHHAQPTSPQLPNVPQQQQSPKSSGCGLSVNSQMKTATTTTTITTSSTSGGGGSFTSSAAAAGAAASSSTTTSTTSSSQPVSNSATTRLPTLNSGNVTQNHGRPSKKQARDGGAAGKVEKEKSLQSAVEKLTQNRLMKSELKNLTGNSNCTVKPNQPPPAKSARTTVDDASAKKDALNVDKEKLSAAKQLDCQHDGTSTDKSNKKQTETEKQTSEKSNTKQVDGTNNNDVKMVQENCREFKDESAKANVNKDSSKTKEAANRLEAPSKQTPVVVQEKRDSTTNVKVIDNDKANRKDAENTSDSSTDKNKNGEAELAPSNNAKKKVSGDHEVVEQKKNSTNNNVKAEKKIAQGATNAIVEKNS